MSKKLIRILPALVAVIVAGLVFCCSRVDSEPELQAAALESVSEEKEVFHTEKETVGSSICVYVSGEVEYPGIYYLEEGARLYEVIELAGGLTSDASTGNLNLASVLHDGQQVVVSDSPEISAVGYVDAETGDGLVNINTASLDELKSLPGIGDARAQAIIAYRNETPFMEKEDIMNVSGIKESLFNQIKDLIKV